MNPNIYFQPSFNPTIQQQVPLQITHYPIIQPVPRHIFVNSTPSTFIAPPVEAPLKLERTQIGNVSEPIMNMYDQPFYATRAINISTPVFQFKRLYLDFDKAVSDPMLTLNPRRLQFIPTNVWLNDNISFGALVATFFRKRNSMHCKFTNKLYNALKISTFLPELIPLVGIEWVTDNVFRVHRANFARLLGVKAIEGGLFHQQGNFPSHGFYELSFSESDELSRMFGFGPVDLSQYRFITHNSGAFRRTSTEEELENCRWNGK